MKNETDKPAADKPENERAPKVLRMMYDTPEPRESVCGCAFGCLDLDTHRSLAHGGHSNIREFKF